MWKDSETLIDLLDYQYMVNVLKDIIWNDDLLPASIGIYGDWGSGKSSLIHMCMEDLNHDTDHGYSKCLIFNGWLFESYSDAKTALLNNILDSISKEKRLGKKAKDILSALYKNVDKFALAQNAAKYGLSFLTTGGIGLLAHLTRDNALAAINKLAVSGAYDVTSEEDKKLIDAIKDELNHKELREDIRQFQEQFKKLLDESKIDRLVIFIDELDRCREDTILDTLEAMKLFMFTGKVAFVIGADERHISYAVKSKFKDIEGIQIDIGKEYLEKLVQYPIKIPRMDIDETSVYIASLLIQSDFTDEIYKQFLKAIKDVRKEDFLKPPLKSIDTGTFEECNTDQFKEDIIIAEQLAEVLSDGLHGNPRQVKRFLNMMDMRMKLSAHKSVTLDRKVLTKIMMLEYVRPMAFNLIAKMAATNTLADELIVIEKAEAETKDIDGVKQLEIWTKDDWFRQWVLMPPMLSKYELNQYFYFTRTSLDEKISRISANLSPTAQEVLDNLLSKSDMKIDKALKTDVSEIEAVNILEAMAAKMKAEAKIQVEHFKAFVEFALDNENRYVTALSYIKDLPPSKLSMPIMIHVVNFAKKSGYTQEIQEVVKDWGKSDPNLESVFNDYLSA